MRISDLGLICQLAGHSADPAGARWNAGICFGRCVRCDQDLVRSATGTWRVPKGYRVVWRAALPTQDPAPVQPMSVEVREPEAAALPARQALFERLKAEPQSIHDEPAQTEPVEVNLGEVADPTEWPIAAIADEKPPRAIVEPVPEPAPAAPEPADEPAHPQAPDFMDEGADADDWDDFPNLRGRSAYA